MVHLLRTLQKPEELIYGVIGGFAVANDSFTASGLVNKFLELLQHPGYANK